MKPRHWNSAEIAGWAAKQRKPDIKRKRASEKNPEFWPQPEKKQDKPVKSFNDDNGEDNFILFSPTFPEEKTMEILNLTQHSATPEQIEAGVVDVPENLRAALQAALTFSTPQDADPVQQIARAQLIARIARSVPRTVMVRDQTRTLRFTAVMIGTAPFFMPTLTAVLHQAGFTVLCAFSRRDSVEEAQPDGSVIKRQVFRHVGFVSPVPAEITATMIAEAKEQHEMAKNILAVPTKPE